MAKTKSRPRKPKQTFIPGTAPPSIKEIDDAAESYVSARNERMELTEVEVDRHAALVEKMVKHELTSYEFDGYTVIVTNKRHAKVKKKSGGDESEEE